MVAEAGRGTVSKSTVSQICGQLRSQYWAFRAPSLGEVELLVLFLDATYLPTRPSGANEGVLVALGIRPGRLPGPAPRLPGPAEAKRGLAGPGKPLTRRRLRPPSLALADGAPGLVRALGELWSDADRQRCAVPRLRKILGKLPNDEHWRERIRRAY